jgi:23S rRNA-/tRNA-specific pseudouridylate synthase
VHVAVKRFPAAHTVDWRSRLVHICRSFLVVDKPGGVPSVPATSNSLECLTSCIAKVRARTAR